MNKNFERGSPAPGILLAATILFATVTSHAEEKVVKAEKEEKSPLSFDIKLNTKSAYVWRGKVLDKDPVTQPSAIATLDMEDYGSFSMKLWSNWDLSTKQSNSRTTKNNGGINVFEYVPYYSKDFGPVGFTVGNIWYTFYPRSIDSTREFFVSLAYKNSVVTPSITAYYDYWEIGDGFLKENPYDSTYVSAALSKTIPLCDSLSLAGTALLGAAGDHYNEVRYKSDNGEGFTDYQMSTSLIYAINQYFSIAGQLAFSGLVGGGAGLDRNNISPDEQLWGAINARVRF